MQPTVNIKSGLYRYAEYRYIEINISIYACVSLAVWVVSCFLCEQYGSVVSRLSSKEGGQGSIPRLGTSNVWSFFKTIQFEIIKIETAFRSVIRFAYSGVLNADYMPCSLIHTCELWHDKNNLFNKNWSIGGWL